MWYSIESVVKPESLREAYSLQKEEAVLFSGGSFLTAEKNPAVKTLIDINELMEDSVHADYDGVQIATGATLQTFIDTVTPMDPDSRLLDGVRASCPSKNIRNQRTFGGEVGQNRPNSDALVFLHAVNAELTVVTKDQSTMSIRDWDGDGIVTEIAYYPNQIDSIELLRFSVIPSAQAVVIVGAARRSDSLEFAIGGTTDRIQNFSVSAKGWNDQAAVNIADDAIAHFKADHFGSLDYKRSLIITALRRGGGAV